jgi:hypothetical protein
MKTREHGAVRGEYVFILEDFHLPDFCVIRQEMVQYTKESTVMISLNIFLGIMVLCKGDTRISNLFAVLFLRNIYLVLNED